MITHPLLLEMIRREQHIPLGMDSDYLIHVALQGLFGKNQFRFKSLMGTQPKGRVEVLFYTRTPLDELQEALKRADVTHQSGVERLSQKEIRLQKGWLVKIHMATCPQRNVTRGGRVNVVPPGATAEERANLCLEWATDRLNAIGYGEIQDLYLDNYTTVNTYRNTHGSKDHHYHQVSIPRASFGGILHVEDPVKFEDLLLTGIGRQRGMGFGFMSLLRNLA